MGLIEDGQEVYGISEANDGLVVHPTDTATPAVEIIGKTNYAGKALSIRDVDNLETTTLSDSGGLFIKKFGLNTVPQPAMPGDAYTAVIPYGDVERQMLQDLHDMARAMGFIVDRTRAWVPADLGAKCLAQYDMAELTTLKGCYDGYDTPHTPAVDEYGVGNNILFEIQDVLGKAPSVGPSTNNHGDGFKYAPLGLNGRPGCKTFYQSGNRSSTISRSTYWNLTDPFTLFALYRDETPNSGNSASYACSIGRDYIHQGFASIATIDDTTRRFATTDYYTTKYGPAMPVNNFYITSSTHGASSPFHNLRINGENVTVQDDTLQVQPTRGIFGFGTNTTDIGGHVYNAVADSEYADVHFSANDFQGTLGCNIVCINMTQDDIDKLEGWAAWKWGLNGLLPTDHPYKYTFPRVAL